MMTQINTLTKAYQEIILLNFCAIIRVNVLGRQLFTRLKYIHMMSKKVVVRTTEATLRRMFFKKLTVLDEIFLKSKKRKKLMHTEMDDQK